MAAFMSALASLGSVAKKSLIDPYTGNPNDSTGDRVAEAVMQPPRRQQQPQQSAPGLQVPSSQPTGPVGNQMDRYGTPPAPTMRPSTPMPVAAAPTAPQLGVLGQYAQYPFQQKY